MQNKILGKYRQLQSDRLIANQNCLYRFSLQSSCVCYVIMYASATGDGPIYPRGSLGRRIFFNLLRIWQKRAQKIIQPILVTFSDRVPNMNTIKLSKCLSEKSSPVFFFQGASLVLGVKLIRKSLVRSCLHVNYKTLFHHHFISHLSIEHQALYFNFAHFHPGNISWRTCNKQIWSSRDYRLYNSNVLTNNSNVNVVHHHYLVVLYYSSCLKCNSRSNIPYCILRNHKECFH